MPLEVGRHAPPFLNNLRSFLVYFQTKFICFVQLQKKALLLSQQNHRPTYDDKMCWHLYQNFLTQVPSYICYWKTFKNYSAVVTPHFLSIKLAAHSIVLSEICSQFSEISYTGLYNYYASLTLSDKYLHIHSFFGSMQYTVLCCKLKLPCNIFDSNSDVLLSLP